MKSMKESKTHLLKHILDVYQWYIKRMDFETIVGGYLTSDFYHDMSFLREEISEDTLCLYYALTQNGTFITQIQSDSNGKTFIGAVRNSNGYCESFVEFYIYPEKDGIRQIFHKAPTEKFMFTRK